VTTCAPRGRQPVTNVRELPSSSTTWMMGMEEILDFFCGSFVPGDSSLPVHRQRESEARSAARIVFCPDSSAVSFHDRSDN
jgi:hypothetical protein